MNKITRRKALVTAGLASALSPLIASAQDWPGFDDLYIRPPWFETGARFIEQCPPDLVEGDRIRLGVFDQPGRRMDLLNTRVFNGSYRRWWGGPKLQEWVGYGLLHRDWYFGMIVMDLKLANYAAIYAKNRKTGQSFSHDAVGSPKNSAVAKTQWNDRTHLTKNNFAIEFIHDLDHGRHRILINIKANKDAPGLAMDLTLNQDLTAHQPLVVSMPIEPRHYMYTHKAVMTVQGTATVGDETISLQPDKDLIILDEFKAFWPLPKRWTWGTAVGAGKDGARLAFNAADYYTPGQNRWNENCLWIDGKLSLLGPVVWDLDEKSPDRPWKLTEAFGRLDLTFHPEAGKTVDLSPAGFKYYQKCGRYEGYIIDEQGTRHEFANLYGAAENGRLG